MEAGSRRFGSAMEPKGPNVDAEADLGTQNALDRGPKDQARGFEPWTGQDEALRSFMRTTSRQMRKRYSTVAAVPKKLIV